LDNDKSATANLSILFGESQCWFLKTEKVKAVFFFFSAIFNLRHTLGHAIRTGNGLTEIWLHGEAVLWAVCWRLTFFLANGELPEHDVAVSVRFFQAAISGYCRLENMTR